MPHYSCESCKTRLYSAARQANLIDPRCASCGVSADHSRSAATRARAPAPIRREASADHKRIVDRFAAFMARGRPDEVARLDAERWLDDGGSFSSEAVEEKRRAPTRGRPGADVDVPIVASPTHSKGAALDESIPLPTRLELQP
jgi:hypothetical protein